MKYIKNGKIATNTIELNGFTIVNPTHEQYLEAGYEVYVPPVVERTIDDYKRDKIKQAETYYNSDEVNLVSINGVYIYLEPTLRFKIKERIDSAKNKGLTTINLILGEIELKAIDTVKAEQMYDSIVIQYGEAYDVKDMHIKTIELLETIEEVEAYDVTLEYPKTLVLDVVINNEIV